MKVALIFELSMVHICILDIFFNEVSYLYLRDLSSHYIRLSLGETTRCRSLTRSTPQGGSYLHLSGTLFFSLLGGLGRMPGIKPKGYAYDGMFLIQGISPDIPIDLAQPAINLAAQ